MEQQRLIPTGECWCGCGGETKRGSFFLPGHDKVAESAVILMEYGSVPGFLVALGYGPGRKSARVAWEQLQRERLGRRVESAVIPTSTSSNYWP